MFFARSAVAVAASMFCLSGFAQDKAPDAVLDPVQVTATRLPESSFEVPQPVTVLDARAISERTPQVMAELLRGAAGAYFQQTGAGQGMAIIRGLKGAEVLHMVDGFRLNNAFFRTAPSQYIALVDPWNIEQLEVLRGPYATLYGPDAMGGVIHIRTAEEHFSSDKITGRTEAKLHFQSADEGKVARVAQSFGNKTFSVTGGFTLADYGVRQVGGLAQTADGAGNIVVRDYAAPMDYTSRGYDLKTLWNVAANQELMFSVQYFDLPNLPRYNEVVPGTKPITAPNSATENPARAASIYMNSREFYHLRYRYTAPLAFVDSLELHLGRQVIDDNRYDLRRNLTRQEFEQNRSTLDGFTASAVSAFGMHRLTYGVELYRDQVKSTKQRKDGAAAPVGTTLATAFKSRFPNGAESDNLGVYVQDSLKLTDRLRSDIGLRANRSSTELPAAPESDRPVGGKIDNNDYSADLGLRYAISPVLAWTFNAGRGYRAPNVNDLAQVGDRANNRVVVANTGLKPESLISGETGLKWRSEKLGGEATVYYAKYKDRITLINPAVPNGQQGCIEAAGCAQNQNIAEATYYGFEGAVSYRHNRTLSASATLNYTWAEQENNGLTEPGNRVPPLNSLLAVQWQVADDVQLEPSLWLNATQDRLDATDKADNRINANGTGGFAVANVALRYTPAGENYKVHLVGENLLDKGYREHGSGVDGRGRGGGLTVQAAFGQ